MDIPAIAMASTGRPNGPVQPHRSKPPDGHLRKTMNSKPKQPLGPAGDSHYEGLLTLTEHPLSALREGFARHSPHGTASRSYLYHYHTLEHEEVGMMRNFRITSPA